MFLFLLAISDWLNFQPCNRKKERWVKIFLGGVAVMVAPQNIRRLSLEKSQALATETRFYLFQNCYFLFFFFSPWEEQVWSRCQVLWWWGWWCSNLFLPLFLAWALFSVLTSWPFREPVESPKPAENPRCQNNNKKGVLCHFSPPSWFILKEGKRLRMRGWRRSIFWQRWAKKLARLSCVPAVCTAKPPKWCMSSSLQLSLHVINLTSALLI